MYVVCACGIVYVCFACLGCFVVVLRVCVLSFVVVVFFLGGGVLVLAFTTCKRRWGERNTCLVVCVCVCCLICVLYLDINTFCGFMYGLYVFVCLFNSC